MLTLPPEMWSLVLGPLGTLVLALVVIVALLKEWVVPKGRLDEMRRDRDAAQALAEKGVSASESITSRLSDRNQRLEDILFSRSGRDPSAGLSQEIQEAGTRITRRRNTP